jgi:hypothetical protein
MKIVFAPDWFLGSDVTIEFVSFFVLLAFFVVSYRNYKLNKNKNSLYLGFGFLLIALAELATVFTKFVLYYDTTFTRAMGQMIISYKVVNSVDIFYNLGFFWHRLLTLIGFYVIYRLGFKKKSSIGGDILIAMMFIIISSWLGSEFYYLFHLTALILLCLIVKNYYELYIKNKSESTKILIISFSLLALSQLIFILSKLKTFYAIAQLIQLISYLILLFLIIRILRAKKKAR